MQEKTHRVYLRWPDSTTAAKTTTVDEEVAKFAFNRLLARADLRGQNAAAAWTCNNKQVQYVELDTLATGNTSTV